MGAFGTALKWGWKLIPLKKTVGTGLALYGANKIDDALFEGKGKDKVIETSKDFTKVAVDKTKEAFFDQIQKKLEEKLGIELPEFPDFNTMSKYLKEHYGLIGGGLLVAGALAYSKDWTWVGGALMAAGVAAIAFGAYQDGWFGNDKKTAPGISSAPTAPAKTTEPPSSLKKEISYAPKPERNTDFTVVKTSTRTPIASNKFAEVTHTIPEPSGEFDRAAAIKGLKKTSTTAPATIFDKPELENI